MFPILNYLSFEKTTYEKTDYTQHIHGVWKSLKISPQCKILLSIFGAKIQGSIMDGLQLNVHAKVDTKMLSNCSLIIQTETLTWKQKIRMERLQLCLLAKKDIKMLSNCLQCSRMRLYNYFQTLRTVFFKSVSLSSRKNMNFSRQIALCLDFVDKPW